MFDLLQKKARGWLGSLANTIPHTCAMCRAPCRSGICPRCREQYFGKPASRCRVCANRLTSQTPVCGACLRHPPPFDHAITATDYVPPVDQLVQSLKFSNRLGLAPSLAELLLLSIREQHPPNIALPSVLTVIPLSPPRLRDRGFNQSLEIARPLAQALQIPLLEQTMRRTRETTPQSALAFNKRRKNIRHAFSINRKYLTAFTGKHVGVVDDVMTTGETMREAAVCLKRAGAARVTCLVFARTPP